jgi:hypothetical protein
MFLPKRIEFNRKIELKDFLSIDQFALEGNKSISISELYKDTDFIFNIKELAEPNTFKLVSLFKREASKNYQFVCFKDSKDDSSQITLRWEINTSSITYFRKLPYVPETSKTFYFKRGKRKSLTPIRKSIIFKKEQELEYFFNTIKNTELSPRFFMYYDFYFELGHFRSHKPLTFKHYIEKPLESSIYKFLNLNSVFFENIRDDGLHQYYILMEKEGGLFFDIHVSEKGLINEKMVLSVKTNQSIYKSKTKI